ncbi:hypothetical protein BWQ96_07735 [Gracilariopsis chorda]|uniref:Uncharacterized protein n=1 Tax=Gracilariopsis chorda TaxID=448386 RepID=A0A2V3IKK4_9FLOR|nr:hypothetical protein BWQ96_07735 [Gracilariopsis chorda]|eukprot:PXF42573.1 hypothetical protein BWQ96_07735 [Gracilariopsis chorda]
MPSKKASNQTSGSKKQSPHARATAVGRKRARADDDNCSPSAAPNSGAEEEVGEENSDQIICTTNRLKKKRASDNEQHGVRLIKEASGSNDEEGTVSKSIRSLSANSEQFIQLSVKNQAILRPSLELLKQAVEVLRQASAIGVLTSAVSLPKVLFIAARKGVDEDEQPLLANKMLVESLLHLAKIQNEELPDYSNIGRRRRSAFADQRFSNYSEADIETARHAAQWALQLLSQSIRGTCGLDDEVTLNNTTQPFQHRDVSEVFVTPRDRLDPFMSQRLTERILGTLQDLRSSGQHQGRNMHVTRMQVSAILRSPVCVTVLNELLLTASHRYVACLKGTSARDSHEFICNIGRDVIRSGELLFRKLSLPTQSILLRHCNSVWKWLRDKVEDSLVGKKALPYDMEKKICEPIALAVADDVTLHWELMDEVRREVSRSSEPFCLRSWRKRRFYRAVFSESQRIIRCGIIPPGGETAQSWHRVPLARRVPSFLRSTANFLDTVERCMWTLHGNTDRCLKAALLAMKYLHQCVHHSGSCCVSATFHAYLLCIEGILERASWLCAKWVVRTLASGTASDHERRLVLRHVAVVMSAIDVFRLPGGTLAETHETLSRSIRQNEAFLTNIALKNIIDLPSTSDRVRINNIMAFTITGLKVFERKGCVTFFIKSIDRFEVAEIIRSLRITMNWADRTSRVCHNAIVEKIKSLVSHPQHE